MGERDKEEGGAGFRPMPLEGLHGCFLKEEVFWSRDSFPVRPSLLISPTTCQATCPA